MAGNWRPDPMQCVETRVVARDTLAGSPVHTWCYCAKGINSQTPTGGHPETHGERSDGVAKEWSTLSDPTKDRPPKAQLVRPKTRSPSIRPSSTCPKTSTSRWHEDRAALTKWVTVARFSWVGPSQHPPVEFISTTGAARVLHSPNWVDDIYGVCFC